MLGNNLLLKVKYTTVRTQSEKPPQNQYLMCVGV